MCNSLVLLPDGVKQGEKNGNVNIQTNCCLILVLWLVKRIKNRKNKTSDKCHQIWQLILLAPIPSTHCILALGNIRPCIITLNSFLELQTICILLDSNSWPWKENLCTTGLLDIANVIFVSKGKLILSALSEKIIHYWSIQKTASFAIIPFALMRDQEILSEEDKKAQK